MRKWLSLLLCFLLALTPVMASAYENFSWLDSWLEEDNSTSYDYGSNNTSSMDDILSLFGDMLEEDDSGSYDYGSNNTSGMDDILSLFGDMLEEDSSDSYDYGSNNSSSMDDLLSLFGDMFEEDDSGSSSWEDNWNSGSIYSYDDFSSSEDDWADMFSSILSGSSGGDMETWENPNTSAFEEKGSQQDTWAIYWYLCGSDLESGNGFATDDLAEMLKVTLPDNVSVVIQTGGAKSWQNNFVNANRLQRWLYQGDELRMIDEQRSASMGSAQTLAEFLDFCNRNFPADKQAVVFWNHGGGSVTGAAFDENYGYDALTLKEMYTAFEAVFDVDAKNPPLEMVGFDTCLMATVDVAHTFADVAKYLVASEEMEPGTGWDYTTFLQALAENPGMNGAQLGRIICDSFAQSCRKTYTHNSITLSVIDLQKAAPLVKAYETYGADVLRASTEDSSFFARFRRAAQKSENYGGNTREEGYSNMVDLGHLARLTTDLLPSAQGVLSALDDCVLYRINGSYRSEATGLSCFYSYNGDIKEIHTYADLGVGDAFAEYYLYSLTGSLSEQGQALLDMSEQQAEALPVFETLADTNWDGMVPVVDDEGVACLNLGPQANEILAGIGFQLYFIDEDKDQMLLLGTDNDMEAHWEEGVFYDNFRGVWGSLNGHLVHMSLTFEGADYNLYTVPILLNGEECHLQVVYDFTSETWSVLGARYGLEDSGMAYKDIRLLRKGDKITILWYAASFSGDDDFITYESHTMTLQNELVFEEGELMDGLYGMVFEMWDSQGNYAYSEPVTFECRDGEIYTYVGG